MKIIPLSKGYCAQVSDKDYVRCVAAGPWHAHVHRKTVYGKRNAPKSEVIYLHRFVMQESNPEILVDHRDGNGLNNCRKNLRRASPSQSQRNRDKQTNNTSGVSGVSWNKHAKKFEAHIKLSGKKVHLGIFESLSEAERVVVSAQKKHYKTFRRTQ